MLASRERILTTHCGSLPRPPQLSDLLLRQEAGERVDEVLLRREAMAAVASVLERQIGVGIDVVSDGEQPRVGFSMYVPQRMTGFGGEAARPVPRDIEEFPLFRAMREARFARRNRIGRPPKAIGEVRYVRTDLASAECQMFSAALSALPKSPAEAFMTAASPGIIATTMPNEFYESYEAYVFALADELRKEYEIIIDAGFLLQLDAPDLGLERARMFKDHSEAKFLQAMELNIEAINRAVSGLPRERIRLH
jgi:5-methyltetrahydropteroyltriglutamate--homocysteine methyltransferase